MGSFSRKSACSIVKETQFSRRASAIASAAAAAAAVQMGLQSTDSHDEDFKI